MDSDGINRLKQGFAPFAIDGDSLFELMADYLDYAAPTGNPAYLMSTINNSHNTNIKQYSELDEDFQQPSDEQANESELQKEQVTAEQNLKTLDCVCVSVCVYVCVCVCV